MPKKMLTSSRELDDCKPLRDGGRLHRGVRVEYRAGAVVRAGAYTRQHEPLLVTAAIASVHFSVQPETLLPMIPPDTAHQKCSRQAEKGTRVAHQKRLR